jgi:hypothetical protein
MAVNASNKPADDLAWTVPGNKLYAVPSDYSGTEAVSRLAPWSVLLSLEKNAVHP